MATDPEFTDVSVSHSSQDAIRATAIVEFLVACLRLENYAISCTSAPGFWLPIGAKFEDQLRLSIKKWHEFADMISKDQWSNPSLRSEN